MPYKVEHTESIKEYNPDLEIQEQFNYNCDDIKYEDVEDKEE